MIYSSIKGGALNISKIGIGGNIFGHFTNQKLSQRILDHAREHGVNLIDTSDTYSRGLSEEFIGTAIAGNRGRWFIATKCGLNSGEGAAGLGNKHSVLKKIEGSLRRLKTEYIDVYQMHHFDPITPVADLVEILEKCVTDGKIRYFGISNYSLAQAQSFYKHVCSFNSNSFLSSQCPFNLFRNEAIQKYLPWCNKHEIAFFSYGVLARGLLSDKYLGEDELKITVDARAFKSESIRSDLDPTVVSSLKSLKLIAAELGFSMPQLAMKYVCATKGVSSAIVGVRNTNQLNELIVGLNSQTLSFDAIENLESVCNLARSGDFHLGGAWRP